MGQSISFVRNCANYVKTRLLDLARQVLPPIGQYVVAHPRRTFFHVFKAIVFIAPGIVFAPFLGVLGFTGAGVAAGSIAAGIQSGIGSVATGSMFATLQSAATGGYGAALVAGTVQGAVVAMEQTYAMARSR